MICYQIVHTMDPKQPPSTEEPVNTKQTAKADDPLPDNLSDALVEVFRPVLRELDVVVEETRYALSPMARL